MPHRTAFRRLVLGLLASLALAVAGLTAPIIPAATSAQAQVSAEFQEALSPYGHWERNPRWGEVWVPDDTPPDWRPYEYGHWIYTDEWGWYWISDPEEEDWGWVTYHYGRWIHDRGTWFWIPGDEWAPAWVDWRYGDDYVGWAPLPPDEVIYEYDDEPAYWIFVPPRFMTARHFHPYMLAPARRAFIFRRSHVINRTLRYGRHRAAVNAGISPAFVARHTGRALPTYRVKPHVLAGTQGVAGAVRVSPQQLRATGPRGRRPSATHFRAVAVQRTTTTIKPTAAVAAPQPLGRNERGRLGTHPPRAAQGAPAVQPLQPQRQLQPQQQRQLQQQPQRQLQQQPQRQLQPPPAGNHREERRNEHPPGQNGARRPPPTVTKPVQPRVMHPPPAEIKPVTPPKAPQVRKPPAAARPQPPVVRHAPPPQIRRVQPQRAPQAARPQPHPAQVRRPPPPKGQPAGKRAPAKPQQKKPNEQPK
jgi:Family of unknown function (DUF6600)